jgi:hypothetical protein
MKGLARNPALEPGGGVDHTGGMPGAESNVVAIVSLESLHGYVVDHYLGPVLVTGDSAYDAADALERRAVQLARDAQARVPQGSGPGPTAQAYVVLGLRFTAGISASGQPEWVAYGTLARGHPEVPHQRGPGPGSGPVPLRTQPSTG